VLDAITPLILTHNEAPNIARTLSKLSWARTVVIVDSLSADRSRELAIAQHPGVRWFERPFTTHAEQWNFGLQQTGITTSWVLALDADFVLTDEIIKEIQALPEQGDIAGYRASFVYCIGGRPLRGAAYPPVVVLFRREAAAYVQDGHTQRVKVGGTVRPLTGRIHHDDRKPLAHWLQSQVRYMRLEAEKLQQAAPGSLRLVDRVRRLIVIAPPAMFVYCLIIKGGLLDGWPGMYYALQRATAELVLSLHLVDGLINGKPSTAPPKDGG
jgi:glycosyltransferase involved in cell wall biosynthesis